MRVKCDNLVKELQEIIRNDYGKDISFDQAEQILRNLGDYFLTLDKICRRIDADN